MPNSHLDYITQIEKLYPREPGILIYPVLINI